MAEPQDHKSDGPNFEGDFQGTYVQRDQIIINLVYPPEPFRLEEPDLAALRARYLKYIRENLGSLDFKGLRLVEAVEKASGLSLEDIYSPLRARRELPEGETWQRIAGRLWHGDASADLEDAAKMEAHTEPILIEEAINEYPALVILGDPGAGKSTLLKIVALSLAQRQTGPLPILIPLNAYAEELERGAVSLHDFLARYYTSRWGSLHHLPALFEMALQQSQAVILLDGLDEVQSRREYLVGLVEAFVREHVPPYEKRISEYPTGNRVLVTSRFVGYREVPLTDKRWQTFALVDWERDEIERFVNRWTQAVEIAMAGGELTQQAIENTATEKRDLLTAVFSNPGIERLAGNPLLLTLLALIKRQGVSLPHRRVELYELYLQTLLRDWRVARTLDKRPVGQALEYLDAIQILAPLALWLRKNNPKAGLIHESQLLDYLKGYFQKEECLNKTDSQVAARNFLQAVHHTNLLLERGKGQYGFIHLTFEEYLAGKGLALLSLEDAIDIITRYLDDPGWHETILLAIGALGIISQQPGQAGSLLEKLLEIALPSEQYGMNIILAGEALRDVEKTGVGSRAARNITQELVATMRAEPVSAKRRQQAGRILGDIGWAPPDLDEFIEIPVGTFLYGDDRHAIEIPYQYWIAKYPVTNLQFDRFIAAGGYRMKEYWSNEGWGWKSREQRIQPAYWTDIEENNPIFPVNGVSWHEAEAYCNWMNTQKLPLSIPNNYCIRLPSEQEWERAARGTDGRLYPWQGDFNETFANTWDGGAGGTTAVGTYPQGVSPDGVWDLSGNIWEWTTSWEDEDRKFRVVRGGSWYGNSRDARCAYRGRFLPSYFDGDIGFRIVLSLARPGF